MEIGYVNKKKLKQPQKNYKNDKIIKKNEQEKNISTRINFLNSWPWLLNWKQNKYKNREVQFSANQTFND